VWADIQSNSTASKPLRFTSLPPVTSPLFPPDNTYELGAKVNVKSIGVYQRELPSLDNEELRARRVFTPVYPALAVRKKLEGSVTLEYRVDEYGDVSNASVLDASQPGIFDVAALQAIAKFKFIPSKINSSPVSTWKVRTVFDFRLIDDEHGPPFSPSVTTEIYTQ
jgi:TonB family protein